MVLTNSRRTTPLIPSIKLNNVELISMRGTVGLENDATFFTPGRKQTQTSMLGVIVSKISVKYFMNEEILLICISWKENDIQFNNNIH